MGLQVVRSQHVQQKRHFEIGRGQFQYLLERAISLLILPRDRSRARIGLSDHPFRMKSVSTFRYSRRNVVTRRFSPLDQDADIHSVRSQPRFSIPEEISAT
jgi:hypothetical protein